MKKQKIGVYLAITLGIIMAAVLGKAVWEKGKSQCLSEVADQTQQNQEQYAAQQQSNKISKLDDKSSDDLEDISFCEKTYTSEKIILDGVDVIKRISEIAKNNKFRICENINNNSNSLAGNLPVKFNKQKSTDVDYKDGVYFLNITLQFKIDLNTNSIYILGGYDGEPTFIGRLK